MNMIALQFLYRGWKARFRDQKAEIASLRAALRPSDVAIDVGANKGSYLPSLSSAVPSGRVVAFEPQPRLVDYLNTAIASVPFRNVIIEGAGVSDKSGTLTLAIPGNKISSPGASFEMVVRDREPCRAIEVPVCTLDEYFAGEQQRIGALKIDVEGHELAVLRGAENILRIHKPIVVCECESRHMTEGDVETVLEYFRSLGYDGSFVWRSRLVPLAEFDPQKHQRVVGERYWDHKDYCNNFVLSCP